MTSCYTPIFTPTVSSNIHCDLSYSELSGGLSTAAKAGIATGIGAVFILLLIGALLGYAQIIYLIKVQKTDENASLL